MQILSSARNSFHATLRLAGTYTHRQLVCVGLATGQSSRQFKEVLKSEQYVDNTYNAYIGALVGVDNGSIQTCLVCVDESVCVSDEKNEGVYFRTKEEILDADLLFNAMLFNQEHWEFVGEKGVGELRTKGAK